MTNLRHDPILQRSVFIAEHRGGRPNNFRDAKQQAQTLQVTPENCPFCPGNELLTPDAVFEDRDEHGNWRVRVVPNKYPAVAFDDESGAHEVIIESSQHIRQFGELSVAQFSIMIRAYRERLRYWSEYGGFRHAALFKNMGPMAGASIEHLHSQLVVLPNVPIVIEDELRRLVDHWQATSHCAFCQRIASERADGRRIIFARDGYVALCPEVSLHAYETWLMPTSHRSSLEAGQDDDALAAALYNLTTRVETTTGMADYNILFFTAPWSKSGAETYHFRIEIRPRMAPLAGLELSTGLYINHVPPELAAKRLREIA